MLLKARFKNFRGFKDEQIAFGPLTVLVGANASGKSTVLQGIQVNAGLSQRDIRNRETGTQATIECLFDGSSSDVRHLTHLGVHREKSPALDVKTQLLHLDLNGLRASNTLQDESTLQTSGHNMANVFASMTRRNQEQLAREFCELVPVFADVTPKPLSHGQHHLIFQDRWSPETWHTTQEVSDGTMLVLAYLLAQHQEQRPDLLAIEEPERGLHPYLLGQLVALFRRMTEGHSSRGPIQIVLATHSAELLNHVHPAEVRFLSRNKDDGSIRVESAPEDSANWSQAFREYDESLGSVWLSGGIGGVPG